MSFLAWKLGNFRGDGVKHYRIHSPCCPDTYHLATTVPHTTLPVSPRYLVTARLATTVRVVEGVFEKVLVVSSNTPTAAGRAGPPDQMEGREP